MGKGSLAKLPEIAKKLGGSHAFIISGPHLAKMGLVEKQPIIKDGGYKTDAFTEIEANPSVATVEKATEKFKESGADLLLHLAADPRWMLQKQLVWLQSTAEASPNMKVRIRCRDQSFL